MVSTSIPLMQMISLILGLSSFLWSELSRQVLISSDVNITFLKDLAYVILVNLK